MNRLQPRRHRELATALLLAATLPGCAVVAISTSVVSAAATVGGAAVSVGSAAVGSTVKVAGKVVEKTIDVAVPSGGAPAR